MIIVIRLIDRRAQVRSPVPMDVANFAENVMRWKGIIGQNVIRAKQTRHLMT